MVLFCLLSHYPFLLVLAVAGKVFAYDIIESLYWLSCRFRPNLYLLSSCFIILSFCVDSEVDVLCSEDLLLFPRILDCGTRCVIWIVWGFESVAFSFLWCRQVFNRVSFIIGLVGNLAWVYSIFMPTVLSNTPFW